jgi:hypothetical protein
LVSTLARRPCYDKTLAQALRPYTVEGPFGQIFDAAEDALEPSFWTMIEMGCLMALGEAAVIPALEYLFHRVEQQLTGRPTLLVIDEAWLFLSHPVFAGRLQAWLKTLRKKNVYVVFATQEVADATSRPALLSTILSACHTKIFLPPCPDPFDPLPPSPRSSRPFSPRVSPARSSNGALRAPRTLSACKGRGRDGRRDGRKERGGCTPADWRSRQGHGFSSALT